MKAKQPIKGTAIRYKEKVIKPARLIEVDTGIKQIVEIRDKNGLITKEERPVMEKVPMQAITETIEKNITVWHVETDSKGLKETHEFATKADATRYYRGVK